MSVKHPIVAVTGSSGAGTTSVMRTFQQIFRREGVNAAYVEGDSFHRYDRAQMKVAMAEAFERGDHTLSHFGTEANLFEELEELFRSYGETGTGRIRKYLHDDAEAEPFAQPPGTFTPWEDLAGDTDLLFYEGLHGGVVSGDVDVARHTDLLVGVVPVINLEWIQKLHRDKATRGYSTEAVTETILRRMHDSDHLREADALVWVDLCDPDPAHLAALAVELDLDPHAVRDAVLAHERAKASLHASHTFVTVYTASLDVSSPVGREPASRESRLVTSRVSTFVLPRGVVTVRLDPAFDIDSVMDRWDDEPEFLRHGVGVLVHGLLDAIVDGHFEAIQQLDDRLEELEDRLFDERARVREVHAETFRLRKELVELRRVVLPMREVVNTVLRHRTEAMTPSPELDGYFADLYDHVLRASEWTESLRDMLTTVFETNLSLQDARLNTIMKKLTGWAAIIAVPTAVTGWFGMNVPYPGFGNAAGVAASAGIIGIVSLVLYWIFRRRDWI